VYEKGSVITKRVASELFVFISRLLHEVRMCDFSEKGQSKPVGSVRNRVNVGDEIKIIQIFICTRSEEQ